MSKLGENNLGPSINYKWEKTPGEGWESKENEAHPNLSEKDSPPLDSFQELPEDPIQYQAS